MTGVILAAGLGTRMGGLTVNAPKCLLPVGGRSLIARSLGNLVAAGVERIVIVTGFREELLRDTVERDFAAGHIEFVRNPRYAETGSMCSLLAARSSVEGEDILLLESDLLYPKRALPLLLHGPHENALLLSRPLGNGDDVYVAVDGSGRVVALGKALPQEVKAGAAGVLVGISRFSGVFLRSLFSRAQEEIAEGSLMRHYEETVLATSLASVPVRGVLAEDLPWTEIDTESDYRFAESVIHPRIEEADRAAAEA